MAGSNLDQVGDHGCARFGCSHQVDLLLCLFRPRVESDWGRKPTPPPIHTMRDLAMLRPDQIVHFVQKTPSLNEVPQFATEHITYH